MLKLLQISHKHSYFWGTFSLVEGGLKIKNKVLGGIDKVNQNKDNVNRKEAAKWLLSYVELK